MLSEHDKQNMGRIVAGYGDWYSANLLRLIAKADAHNLAKLREVYPDHVAAFEAWQWNQP